MLWLLDRTLAVSVKKPKLSELEKLIPVLHARLEQFVADHREMRGSVDISVGEYSIHVSFALHFDERKHAGREWIADDLVSLVGVYTPGHPESLQRRLGVLSHDDLALCGEAIVAVIRDDLAATRMCLSDGVVSYWVVPSQCVTSMEG